MPLTEFAGGEDYLLSASRAGKRGKQQAYAALAKMRSEERKAAQKIIDEQNMAKRKASKYQMGRKFSGLAKKANIKFTGPKDITFEDVESGNLSTEDYNDLSARFSGQDPRVTRGLRVADALGLTSAARTLFGKNSPYSGAGGRLVGEVLSRIMPDDKYKYTFNEYGENVGTGAYTTEPSSTDPLIAASIVTPAKGFSPAMRSLIGTAKAIDRRMPRPVTAGILGGTGVAAGVLAQPEEAKAWSPKTLFKAAAKNKNILNTSFKELPQELKTSLNDAARKQNKSTQKRLQEKRGEPINKADWFEGGVGITGFDLWEEAKAFFNASEFTDDLGVFTDEGLSTAEKALTGGRSRSLQYSHIDALEEAKAADKPYVVQGPGKGILTWPRVNRSMGSQNMIPWLNMLEDTVTREQIIKQLGRRYPKQ